MANSCHQRDTNARRTPSAARIAAPIAAFATLAAVGAGVLLTKSDVRDQVTVTQASIKPITRDDDQVSRSVNRLALAKQARAAATRRAIAHAKKHLFTTAELNLWTASTKGAKLLGTIDAGKKVLVTGRRAHKRAEIVVEKKARWVTAEYLSADKPVGPAAGLNFAPCPDSSVEGGLVPNADLVHRAVCHAFPQITTYGGWDAHGEHSSGRAIDIMTSDSSLGQAIADFLVAHAAELHLYDVIWSQHIWTQERASEGWRPMSDRGSATANHYDHVHVSAY